MSKATLSLLEKDVETNDDLNWLWANLIAEAEVEKVNNFQREEMRAYKFLGFCSNTEVEADNQGDKRGNMSAPHLSAEQPSAGRYRFLGFGAEIMP